MLRTKLFKGFAGLAILFSVLSALVGVRVIRTQMIVQAQQRVQLDLTSAWSIYNSRLHDIETVLKLTASKEITMQAFRGAIGDEGRARLESVQHRFDLDFMTLVAADGKVILRTAPPCRAGDYVTSQPAVERALRGEVAAGTLLLTRDGLDLEAAGLSERAYMALEDTPRARPTASSEEARGMVMLVAVPVVQNAQVLGCIYGGLLLNRNEDLIDRIQHVVYANQMYGDVPLGTATLFLKDSRIATTVRLENNNRAIGTRVSKEVADRVLDNGLSWVDRAFVVRDWYLTAYDPIRDLDGEVIGMLYVGTLERPYRDLGRQIILRYAGLLAFSLAVALALAFILAGRLARPIHELVEATKRMHKGERHTPVKCYGACDETGALVEAFNEMADALAEREARLQEANESLKAMNRSYMDMLGFVSHELKSPVSAIMNYAYLLRQQRAGALNEKQMKAALTIEHSAKRMVEMVRHYLNLSRIENAELHPVPTRVKVLDEVVQPLLDSVQEDVSRRHMVVENGIAPDVMIHADLNMAREAFENLVSNAVKYGRDGGRIRLGSSRADGRVVFTVGNEGDGIPPEKIPFLFNKFSRLEGESPARRQKGTGLGLFITKHIIEAHGGRIEVESRPGEWTEFKFSMAIEKEQEN